MSQTQIFRGIARKIVRTAESTEYRYHNTAVVTHFIDGRIVLDSGGWHTNTTKNAMNQASNQFGLGFQVSQRDFSWYVTFAGKEYDFEDGLVLGEKSC